MENGSPATSDTDLMAMLDSDTPEAETETAEPEVETEADEQAETPSKDAKESVEDKLNKFKEEESPKDGKKDAKIDALLEEANSAGILRNGLPVKFESRDEIIKHLSQMNDYTKKTQEVAEQRKAQEKEFSDKEADLIKRSESLEKSRLENHDKLQENNVLWRIIGGIKEREPEVFAELENAYNSQMDLLKNQLDNPAVKALQTQVKSMEEKFGNVIKLDEEKENRAILKEWESGLKEVQDGWGKKLSSLGLRPEWDKVQSAWKNDKTGTLTVKAAFLAHHGEQLTKLLESKNKLVSTKAKSQARTNGGSSKKKDDHLPDHLGNSYLPDTMSIARELGVNI